MRPRAGAHTLSRRPMVGLSEHLSSPDNRLNASAAAAGISFSKK